MKVVLQRVSSATVSVCGEVIDQIAHGWLVFLGIGNEQDSQYVERMAEKIVNLRAFNDEFGKMNLSLMDVKGEVLIVSQFTLYADCKKGRRPSFQMAARPEVAIPIYEGVIQAIQKCGVSARTGRFGADMSVQLINDGPVTIVLSENDL
ncbi:MAG: D-aminoacyl-tRNA deacylase [Proteobacteria bacterium]|nr:D-aminoacyl-tRNA deacylase [Pseudomonadota bacterium]